MKWSIKYTWNIMFQLKKNFYALAEWKWLGIPFRSTALIYGSLRVMESKTHKRSKTSENLWSSGHWSEINSLLTASLRWHSFPLNWNPAAQVYFNPTIHDSLSWDMKRHKCPYQAQWHPCLFNDYWRCICWLVQMAAHTAVIQS